MDVETFLTKQSCRQSYYADFLTFLRLISILTLMLAGPGIHSSLAVFIREQEDTIINLRTNGAIGHFAIIQFYGMANALVGGAP